jgi:hypothetical protein
VARWYKNEGYKKLLLEWDDARLPSEVTSHTKVWWKCTVGHRWQTTVNGRAISGCPKCSRVGKRKTVKSHNSIPINHPELLSEWHSSNTLRPEEISRGSNVVVKWVCKEGHEWDAPIKSRTSALQGCPVCSHHRIDRSLSLAIVNPGIAAEWHPHKNTFSPNEVFPQSSRKVWWLCSQGHEWQATVANRVYNGSGCPECLGRVINGTNCLQATHPKLVAEWHPRNDITPYEVTRGSHSLVWWKCSEGHEWQATVNRRTNPRLSAECPQCWHPWKGEDFIANWLRSRGFEFIEQKRFPSCRDKRPLAFDFYLERENLVIEYDGQQHFMPVLQWGGEEALKTSQKRDAIKNSWCRDNKIALLRVSYLDDIEVVLESYFSS